MQTQPLPGFRDFYPADLAFRAHIFETWRLVARRYGFEEYDGPPLEPLDLYTAKSGDEIVGQLYNFVDKGARDVALRPEMTPTLARMVAARANGLKKPIRWFSIPQLFRYERQQRGRLREHFQLNCDLIGEAGPQGDAEIIALAIDIMRALGLTEKDVRVRVSDRGLFTELLLGAGVRTNELATVFGIVDKIERLSEEAAADAFGKAEIDQIVVRKILEVLALNQIERIEAALDAAPNQADFQSSGRMAAGPLKQVIASVQQMGLGKFIEIDLRIVRGLAYYTGTVFELFDADKTLRAICGGGRYDTLTEAVGGVSLHAVGFGMGDVVLGELLKDRGLAPAGSPTVDAFVAGVTAEDLPHVLQLAHNLRDAGVRVEYSLRHEALGKQLKLADARQAAFAVLIGPDDRARGEVQLKDLRNNTQRALAAGALVGELKQLIATST